MSTKDRADFEDRLKVLVHKSVLAHRQNLCKECDKCGENKFCQVNLEYLPEFQQYRYYACPIGRWKESW